MSNLLTSISTMYRTLYTNLAAGILPIGGDNGVNIPKNTVEQGNLNTLLKFVFAMAGAISVIVIMLAGIKFMTSQGNPDGVAKARNAIIYAAIGLAICIAAFSIVTLISGKF